MKKRIICLLAALLLLLGLSVSASAAVYANVIDTAELLSESEAEALDARCSELEQTYGCGVYLVTVDDYTAYYSADSIESFAESVFLDLGLGAGEEQDGVLLVLSMAERDYDICAHGTIGNRTFTDYGKGVLAERWFLEPFSRDDWSGGLAAFLDGCEEYLRMDAEGADYADVLADAQAKGYAEADPSADVDGFDAASKTAILASIGFGTRVTTDDVYQQGIRTIGAEDIAQARELGYTIKLLGIARNTDAGVDVRVHPTLIPADHMLAKVNGAMNAVYVVGDAVGETMFYGAGAGSFPTASAVVGDILSLSEQISRGVAPLPEIEPYGHNLAFKPMDELQTKYYVRLKVADRVGALSETVDIFAKHSISISLINQVEDGKSDASDVCSVIFLTHRALEKDVQAAAAELASVDCVAEVANVLRIEDVEAWTEGVMAN